MEGSQRDFEITKILRDTRYLAVVGIKDIETEDAFRIPKYMQEQDYEIVPVNPKLERVLGEVAYPDLETAQAAHRTIDLINIFRAPEMIAGHVDEILAMSPRPKAVWMQLGIHDGPSAARLRSAGIEVVQDRCIMVDHRRLLRDSAAA